MSLFDRGGKRALGRLAPGPLLLFAVTRGDDVHHRGYTSGCMPLNASAGQRRLPGAFLIDNQVFWTALVQYVLRWWAVFGFIL